MSVIRKKGIVEIVPRGLHKGLAIDLLLSSSNIIGFSSSLSSFSSSSSFSSAAAVSSSSTDSSSSSAAPSSVRLRLLENSTLSLPRPLAFRLPFPCPRSIVVVPPCFPCPRQSPSSSSFSTSSC